jgi:nicotinamidase/pyrazinamidase
LKDAIKENFNVNLIEDATRPLDLDDFDEQKKELKTLGAKIINSREL